MKIPFKKLPAYFQSHPIFQKVYNHTISSKVLHGMLLYKRNNDQFLILKDGTLHVPFDWQIYSLMRAVPKLSINSGQCIRQEKGVYLKRESYGDPYVDQLYQTLLSNNKQKLLIFTRKMVESQIQQLINPNLYQLVKPPKYKSLPNLLEQALKVYEGPFILQFGLNALTSYFKGVQEGEKNNLDLLVLTSFEGDIPSQHIGQKFQIPVEKYYEKVWTSEKIPCKLHNNADGSIKVQILTIKK